MQHDQGNIAPPPTLIHHFWHDWYSR